MIKYLNEQIDEKDIEILKPLNIQIQEMSIEENTYTLELHIYDFSDNHIQSIHNISKNNWELIYIPEIAQQTTANTTAGNV